MTLQEILANPDVLWAVLREVQSGRVKIAGPWERTEESPHTRSTRREPNLSPGEAGESVADCWPSSAGWCAWVTGVGSAEYTRAPGTLDREAREAAESWCDAQLRAQGWMLATGEVERA